MFKISDWVRTSCASTNFPPIFNNPHTGCTIPHENDLPLMEANSAFRKTNSSMKRTVSSLPGSVTSDLWGF